MSQFLALLGADACNLRDPAGLNLFGRPTANIPQAPVPGAFIDASQRMLQKVRSIASSSDTPKGPSSPAPV